MLYRPETGDLIPKVTQHRELTVKGLARLISGYLNDDNVRLLLKTATHYDSTAQIGTGALMGHTSSIRADGYHFRFRNGYEPTCVIPWGAPPDWLIEPATELVQSLQDSSLRHYWDNLRQSLTTIAHGIAIRQGLWKETERAQERAIQTKPEEDDAAFEAFLREVDPSQ